MIHIKGNWPEPFKTLTTMKKQKNKIKTKADWGFPIVKY